ncbi:MAG: phospholipase/carboxylesterase [Cellvibrionaceae bacterium]|jgi:phospholipase/carboxylesterase
MLDAIEIETGSHPNTCIIWLHGLGASGHDFEPIIPELELPENLEIRFIFPHAPKRVITINGGLMMPAWYDIITHDVDRRVDIKQLVTSAGDIAKFIDREIQRGIARDRIFIAGFSQGGAVGYQLALTYPRRLGGLIALSTYFATHKNIEYHPANAAQNIFIGHGLYDSIVAESLGQRAHALLEDANYSVNYHSYPMDHSVCAEEINDISQWLKAKL